jgi:hypothetical protein
MTEKEELKKCVEELYTKRHFTGKMEKFIRIIW